MAFRKHNKTYSIGDWVITTKDHKNCYGVMEAGTKVQIMDIGERGYDIQDEDGNLVTEIGYVI